MWLRTFLTSLMLAALLTAAGCGDSPGRAGGAESPAERALLRAADYFPGEPGMRWKYRGHGNEFASFVAETTDREGERVQIVAMSGAAVARVYEVTPERITQILIRAEDESGASFLDLEPEMARVVLEAPLVAGREWQAAPGETRRIEAVGATVETPAGRFENALRLRVVTEGSMDLIEYYALGVGLVRQEFLAEDPIISELEEFVIAAPTQ